MTLKDKINGMTKDILKSIITNNLGIVVELDNKIICYVDSQKLKEKDGFCEIFCSGVNDEEREILETYGLNKPIQYIISDSNFLQSRVCIIANKSADVLIRNCNFDSFESILGDGNCIIENSNIKSQGNLYIVANNIVIKGTTIQKAENQEVASIAAKYTLDIIDSNIDTFNDQLSISATSSATSGLNVTNSKLIGSKVEMLSNNVVVDDDSQVVVKDNVHILSHIPVTLNINGKKVYKEALISPFSTSEDSYGGKRGK